MFHRDVTATRSCLARLVIVRGDGEPDGELVQQPEELLERPAITLDPVFDPGKFSDLDIDPEAWK